MDRRFPSAVKTGLLGTYSLHCVNCRGLPTASTVLGATLISHRLNFFGLGLSATQNTMRQSGDQASVAVVPPELILYDSGSIDSATRTLAGPPRAGRTSMAELESSPGVVRLLVYAIQRPSGDHTGPSTFSLAPTSTSF